MEVQTGIFAAPLRKLAVGVLQQGPVPQHVAFIMDGNRRYAQKRGQETKEGHNSGYNTLSRILDFCYQVGIHEVTVYAFSLENFRRPTAEVEALMEIARTRLRQICDRGDLVERYGIRINFIGDLSLLPEDVQETCRYVADFSRKNTHSILNICMPYTARDDIAHSIRTIAKNKVNSNEIDESTIRDHMYTAGSRPLDLLIRTSDTNRFSDFLLWETESRRTQRGTHIVFSKSLWPEYSVFELFWTLVKWSYSAE
ncbi:Dehydrodolichyl diphosphate synthase complex subunit RER2 [Wickerhamiella sorbophila]|uniref:Alkyl transferase n=1 Tax=Wickerhamiella sorbophila TaxID=45607 RepID=A0A2T0FGM8_9ASCO|nr:Dehydrodolichyl diphosphate synthase complex subunit RER2 [Wickerhamiella sorbophila]PRT54148.1 Dehydrodolichyl diphosphate synthase complex subunit RER2 [Wickerhamiella sorbophila]